MKKLFCICLILCLFLAGCQQGASSEPAGGNPPVEIHSLFSENTRKSIDVRSLAELETMRAMAVSTDEEAVQAYLTSGSGAESQADLVNFLKLVDSLPKLDVLDGEIGWISLQTGNGVAALYITVDAENGDWIRTEYLVSVTDIDAELARVQNDSEASASLLSAPFSAVDNRVKLYSQNIRTSEDIPGATAVWRMSIDGIYGFIFYHSATTENIAPADVFQNATISRELANA